MSVQFGDEDQLKARSWLPQEKPPYLVDLVEKWSGGTIHTTKQATYVLVGIIIVCVAFSLFFLFGSKEESNLPPAIHGTVQQ